MARLQGLIERGRQRQPLGRRRLGRPRLRGGHAAEGVRRMPPHGEVVVADGDEQRGDGLLRHWPHLAEGVGAGGAVVAVGGPLGPR